MSDIVNIKFVKTRKDHTCWGCKRQHPKGTEMQVITAAEEGYLNTAYWCKTCQAYWSEHMHDGEEIYEGELKSEDPDGWDAIRQTVEVPE